MHLTTLACAALAVMSTASAASLRTMKTYNVSCKDTYTVVNGDTCSKIAQQYGILTSQLKKWNPSINSKCSNLYIDQVLCMSNPTTTSETVPIDSSCTAGSYGLAQGNGYSGYCCKSQADCQDDCINGTCNGPKAPSGSGNTGSGNTGSSGSSGKCLAGVSGLAKGNGYSGYCCKSQADCQDDCVKGVCNGPKAPSGSGNTGSDDSDNGSDSGSGSGTSSTGKVVQLSSSKDFCLFLPSSPGNKAENGGKVDIDAIASSEKSAVAFCTKPNVNAPNAGLFPKGFITSAKYQTKVDEGFVQIRGKIDISKYSLSPKDDGGQYDNHGAGSPPNSSCAGYRYYVSMVEPSTGDFCIRCCSTYANCNAGRSEYGCNRVVPEI
ncbi:hypothetical protein BD560DRAFT_394004 [Blakeslea trispora]|nr:hypothetical protein BD560DRAFT_394004 [Blakeslea trispora]